MDIVNTFEVRSLMKLKITEGGFIKQTHIPTSRTPMVSPLLRSDCDGITFDILQSHVTLVLEYSLLVHVAVLDAYKLGIAAHSGRTSWSHPTK